MVKEIEQFTKLLTDGIYKIEEIKKLVFGKKEAIIEKLPKQLDVLFKVHEDSEEIKKGFIKINEWRRRSFHE